jgi:hypothetical protein
VSRVIARPPCAFWRSTLQVPAVGSPNFGPARPPRLVYVTSTSMGGFPFRERGLGVSNR